jgi:hypothetical protein
LSMLATTFFLLTIKSSIKLKMTELGFVYYF